MHSAVRGSIERVVLTGFMGAGKSTVGRILAPLLGWRLLDIDSLLCDKNGATVVELFAQHGEQGFRRLEAAAIAEALQEQNAVIALGGGAIEHAETRALLSSDPLGLIVYLEAPFAVSLARCAGEPGAAVRPLLQDSAALEQRFRARLPFYRAAHLTVLTSEHTPDEIAKLLAEEVRRER